MYSAELGEAPGADFSWPPVRSGTAARPAGRCSSRSGCWCG